MHLRCHDDRADHAGMNRTMVRECSSYGERKGVRLPRCKRAALWTACVTGNCVSHAIIIRPRHCCAFFDSECGNRELKILDADALVCRCRR